MKNFNRHTIKEIRKDLTSILEILEDQHNIKLELGAISYALNGSNFSVKLTGISSNENGDIISKVETDYNFMKSSKMKKLGDTFIFRGEVYTICGWKPRSTKYPLLGKSAGGTIYKFARSFANK